MTDYEQAETPNPFGVVIEQPDPLEGNINAQFIEEGLRLVEDMRQRGSALGINDRSELSNSERVLNIIKSLPESDISQIERAFEDFDGELSIAHLGNPDHPSDFTAEPLSPEGALSTIISIDNLGAKLGEAYQKAVSPDIEDQPVYFDADFGEYLADTPSTALPDEQAEIVDDHVREFYGQYTEFVEGRSDLLTLLAENDRIRDDLKYGDNGMSQQDRQTALLNFDQRTKGYVELEVESNYPELKEQAMAHIETMEELGRDLYLHPLYEFYEDGIEPWYGFDIDSPETQQFSEDFLADYQTYIDSASAYITIYDHTDLGIEIPIEMENDMYQLFAARGIAGQIENFDNGLPIIGGIPSGYVEGDIGEPSPGYIATQEGTLGEGSTLGTPLLAPTPTF